MLKNKKGISPLIATILIIGITVVIAVMIFSWLESSTEGLQCNTECTIAGASECQYASGDLELTYNSGSESAVIVNSGSRTLSGTIIWLENGASIDVDSEIGLEPGSSDAYGMPEGATHLKAVAGITPTLTGDCEGTTCAQFECWSSEEITV